MFQARMVLTCQHFSGVVNFAEYSEDPFPSSFRIQDDNKTTKPQQQREYFTGLTR